MASLWGDGWFYISVLGLLGSGVLFLYLLGQYRSTVEAAEESDAAFPSPDVDFGDPLPAKPVVVEMTPAAGAVPIVSQSKAKAASTVALPGAVPAHQTSPSGTAEQPPSGVPASAWPDGASAATSAAPSTLFDPGYTGPERRRSDLTSNDGISLAVVFLQSIKSQMESYDKDIAQLQALSAQQAAQGELVLKRLSELAESLKTGASLSAPTRSAKLALETAPEAAAAAPAAKADQPDSAPPASAPSVPAPEAKAEPAAAAIPAPNSPSPYARLLKAYEDIPATSAPAPEPDVQPSHPRKGPVWPV
jgi:hypothetical protein